MSEGTPLQVKEHVLEVTSFDPTIKKKKKKKKKQQKYDQVDDFVDNLVDRTGLLEIAEGLESSFLDLKKKKIPVEDDILNGLDLDFDLGLDFDGDEGGEKIGLFRYPWKGSDRDYMYEELLSRVFDSLRENNPELFGDRRRTFMRPPQVLHEGTKKTVFVNFMDICKTMHRETDHVMTFLLAEMGTSGSLDGQQRLVLKGRFDTNNFEGILRRYINEYVLCTSCRSPATILTKENHLFFLRCEQCGSGRSVAPIKTGFIARVGHRDTST